METSNVSTPWLYSKPLPRQRGNPSGFQPPFTAEQLRAYRTKAYMKFYLRPDLIRRKFSKAEGREELLEVMSGATVLSEIVKSTVLKRIPEVGLGKIATV